MRNVSRLASLRLSRDLGILPVGGDVLRVQRGQAVEVEQILTNGDAYDIETQPNGEIRAVERGTARNAELGQLPTISDLLLVAEQ